MPNPTQAPQTITEETAGRLRQELLRGAYSPGAALPQRGLARSYGVSPIVMRESLRMLENEGLVENIPRWGSRVVPFCWDTLRGNYLVREALEGMVARLVAGRITAIDRARLMALATELDRLFSETPPDVDRMAVEHERLHQSIDLLCRCTPLLVALKRLSVRQLILYTSRTIDLQHVRQPATWHQDLVATVCDAEPDEAEQAMRRHVRKGWEDLCASREVQEHGTNGGEAVRLPLDGIRG